MLRYKSFVVTSEVTFMLDFVNTTHQFNVFHVRALYYTKNFEHQRMHEEFFRQL
jgi:hypothetical protein